MSRMGPCRKQVLPGLQGRATLPQRALPSRGHFPGYRVMPL